MTFYDKVVERPRAERLFVFVGLLAAYAVCGVLNLLDRVRRVK